MQPYLLPCYFVLVFGTLLFIWRWFAGRRNWYTVPRDPAADKLCNDATIWFHAAEKQFLKWREARPFLHVGQSAYARSLVRDMICAYKLMLMCDEEMEDLLLVDLYALLNDLPPSQDPPVTAKPLSGGLLFILVDERDTRFHLVFNALHGDGRVDLLRIRG